MDRARYGEYPKNVLYTSTMYNNQKKKALHVLFSLLFGNLFHVILHSHQIGLRIHLYMLHVLFGFNTFKNIYRFLNNFEKMMLKKLKVFVFSFFSFFIENCFYYQRNSKKYACD